MMRGLVSVSYPAVTVGGRTRGCWAAPRGLGRLVTSILGLRLGPGLLGGTQAAQLEDHVQDGISIGGELDPRPGITSSLTTELKLECPRPDLSLRLKQIMFTSFHFIEQTRLSNTWLVMGSAMNT